MNHPQPEPFTDFYRASTLAIEEMELAERRKKEPNYEPKEPPKPKSPFPWQIRLAVRVCDDNRDDEEAGWPRAIALPTAAGKTACIDVAIFALACRAKDAPRRIFFTVDRRIVVDQAFDHAKKLAKVLDRASEGVLRIVADELRSIAEPEWLKLSDSDRLRILKKRWQIQDETDAAKREKLFKQLTIDEREWFEIRPLDVYALRGGMYRETAWIRSPLQPTVIASTVDQVGSRLLFRGYGVSHSMKPIHAGLVGNDALILLDEAHCAKPFEQTVQAVEKYREWTSKLDDNIQSEPPFEFVSITATPTEDIKKAEEARKAKDPDGTPLILEPYPDDFAHPILGPRIRTPKPATLVHSKKGKLLDDLKSQAESLMGADLGPDEKQQSHTVRAVGVIVNRVKTARALAEMLKNPKAKKGETLEPRKVILLTGRMRPLDRDAVLKDLEPLFSNSKTPLETPTFVVATQCLEVGADLDFHALVTECASLDALRQRFGRLNRVAARPSAKAVVVCREEFSESKEKEKEQDPIYGNSLPETWRFLTAGATRTEFDFGVSAITKSLKEIDPAPLNAPSEDAPVLFPAHLDCWVQTHPIPTPDPDPALFLHGPKKPGQPDVQVVFRDDLGDNEKLWAEIVELCPPSSSEAVAVPIGVFKKWLAGEKIDDPSGDTEGGAVEDLDADEKAPAPRKALLWRGLDDSTIISGNQRFSPNSMFVIRIPAEHESTELEAIRQLADLPENIKDYSQEAFQKSRDKALLRFRDMQFTDAMTSTEQSELIDAAIAELKQASTSETPLWLKVAIDELADRDNRKHDVYPDKGVVVYSKHRLRQFDPTYLEDSEPNESFRGRPVSLVDHSRGVASYAIRFATACGLPVDTYHLAGLYHDLGKLDPRFQKLLKGYSAGTPLAKSGSFVKREWSVHQYPKGARHELLSAAILAQQTSDELLLHLVATHHGSARPFADPVEENPAASTIPQTELLGLTIHQPSAKQDIAAWNAELPERFWRMVRQYGWWGIAYREAIFRLADHAQSAAEQEAEGKTEPPETAPPALPAIQVRPQTYPLPLTGLDGSNPLAFLAALGTLRLCDKLYPGCKLRWELNGVWQPVLEFPVQVEPTVLVTQLHMNATGSVDPKADAIADALHKSYRKLNKSAANALNMIKARRLKGKEREQAIASEVAPLELTAKNARQEWLEALDSAVPAPYLSLGKSINVTQEEFASYADRMAQKLYQSKHAGRAHADFVPSFGCEAIVDKNDRVIPTDFQLISGSGHQYFLETICSLMQCVTESQIYSALFEQWKYQDRRLSLRWDPLEDRRYAYAWDDPGDDNPVPSVHGANLLASYAIPLFLVAPQLGGAITTGFHTQPGQLWFTWPIWMKGQTVDMIRSLLTIDHLSSDSKARNTIIQYGIDTAFRVRKFEVGKPPLSKWNFSPSTTVCTLSVRD